MIRTLTSSPRKILAAAAIVAALGIAAPAAAAENVQFGFSFGNGNNGFSLSLDNGGFNGRVFQPQRPVCYSDNQLRGQLRAQGLRFVAFGGQHRGWIHASARKHGRVFEFDVNRCTAEIVNFHPAGNWGNGGPGNGGPGNGGPGNGGWNQGGWGNGGPGNGGWNQGGWN